MKVISKLNKFYLLVFLIFFSIVSIARSEIYNKIIVEGNQRLSIETVIIFSGLDINTEVNNDDLNRSIKNLYETDYFKDIKLIIEDNIIKIKIIENPIIQSITIKNIKNKSLLKQLNQIVKKSEKYPFLKDKIQKTLYSEIIYKRGIQ